MSVLRRVKSWDKLLNEQFVKMKPGGVLYNTVLHGRFNNAIKNYCGKQIELKWKKDNTVYKYKGAQWSWAEWMLEPVKEDAFTTIYERLKADTSKDVEI